MIPGLGELLDRLKELHEKKAKDYTGTNPSPFYNFEVAQYLMSLFEKDEDKVYACLIGIKLGRISTLRNSGQEPNNESLLDSFDDQILYTAFWRQMIVNSSKQEIEITYPEARYCGNCDHHEACHHPNEKCTIPNCACVNFIEAINWNEQCQNCGHSRMLHNEAGVMGNCQKGDGFGNSTCRCLAFVPPVK